MFYLLLLPAFSLEQCGESCEFYMLGNGVCEEACYRPSCSDDYKDCNTLPDLCSYCKTLENDSICQSKCYNNCNLDIEDCNIECSKNCFLKEINDGTCNGDCITPTCAYDGKDCSGYCDSGCTFSMLSDGVCQSDCNVLNCSYDNGDCENDNLTQIFILFWTLLLLLTFFCVVLSLAFFVRRRRNWVEYNRVAIIDDGISREMVENIIPIVEYADPEGTCVICLDE